jgi:hypothetical protein
LTASSFFASTTFSSSILAFSVSVSEDSGTVVPSAFVTVGSFGFVAPEVSTTSVAVSFASV